jgi:tetratricopeptide (TPR) repeat protein
MNRWVRRHRSSLAWGLVLPTLGFVLVGVAWWLRREAPETTWAAAEADFRAGRWARAELGLQRLARARPPTPEDWMLRAQVAMARGRTADALNDLARVPDRHRLAAQARLAAGQLELRRDRLQAAETLLRRAAELDPKLVQAWRELIFIYGIQLRRVELGRAFQALSELVPLTYNDVFVWCLTRGVNWDPSEQVRTLMRYLDNDPGDRYTRLALAENLELLGRIDEAAKVLFPLPDDDSVARAVRARLALHRGDIAAAERLLAEGAENDPTLARLRGRLALLRRKPEDALRHFRAADGAEPDQRETLIGLAQALQMAGKPEQGTVFAKRVRDHDLAGALVQKSVTPEGHADKTMFVRLGKAYAEIGRLPEARAWLKLAIQRDPLDAEAQRTLHQTATRRVGDAGRQGPPR